MCRGAWKCAEGTAGCIEVCGGVKRYTKVHGSMQRGMDRCVEVCEGIQSYEEVCREVYGDTQRCMEVCRSTQQGVWRGSQ